MASAVSRDGLMVITIDFEAGVLLIFADAAKVDQWVGLRIILCRALTGNLIGGNLEMGSGARLSPSPT
jgi:hypothetical protein